MNAVKWNSNMALHKISEMSCTLIWKLLVVILFSGRMIHTNSRKNVLWLLIDWMSQHGKRRHQAVGRKAGLGMHLNSSLCLWSGWSWDWGETQRGGKSPSCGGTCVKHVEHGLRAGFSSKWAFGKCWVHPLDLTGSEHFQKGCHSRCREAEMMWSFREELLGVK